MLVHTSKPVRVSDRLANVATQCYLQTATIIPGTAKSPKITRRKYKLYCVVTTEDGNDKKQWIIENV